MLHCILIVSVCTICHKISYCVATTVNFYFICGLLFSLEMSSTRKICQLCGKQGKTRLSVGTKAGNEIVARNILYEYQTYGSECFVDPRVMGWSGEPNDHKSIAEFFIRNNASFHSSCRKQFSDQKVQRNREKRAAAYAPIAAASQLAVEEEHVIQEIAGSSDEPTETNAKWKLANYDLQT